MKIFFLLGFFLLPLVQVAYTQKSGNTKTHKIIREKVNPIPNEKTDNLELIELTQHFENQYIMIAQLLSKGFFAEALDSLDKLIPFISQNKQNIKDTLNYLIQIYRVKSAVYNYKMFQQQALEMAEKCLKLCEKLSKEQKEKQLSSIYQNIAYIYQSNRQYHSSLEYLLKAKQLNKKFCPENHLNTANLYMALGGVYHDLKDYSPALDYYQKAYQIKKKLLGENHPFTVSILHNIALLYQQQRDFPKALGFYLLCLEVYQKNKSQIGTGLGGLYRNIAALYKEKNQTDSTIYYSLQALETYQGILGKQKHPYLALALGDIAAAYQQKADYPTALSYYQKALVQGLENFDNPDVYSLPETAENTYTFVLLQQKARTFWLFYGQNRDKKNLRAALQIYQKIDKDLQAIQIKTAKESDQLLEREALDKIYQEVLEACWEAGR